jgi:hypothetical protein
MLRSEQNDEMSDTTGDDSSNADDNINIFFRIFIKYANTKSKTG